MFLTNKVDIHILASGSAVVWILGFLLVHGRKRSMFSAPAVLEKQLLCSIFG